MGGKAPSLDREVVINGDKLTPPASAPSTTRPPLKSMPNLSRRSTKFLSASAAKTLKPTNVSIEPISIVFRSILSSITITIPSCVILCAMKLPPQFGYLREIRQHLSGRGPARVEHPYLGEPERLARRVAAGGHEARPPGIVNQLVDLVIPCRVTVDGEPVPVGDGTDQQYLGRAPLHPRAQPQPKLPDPPPAVP